MANPLDALPAFHQKQFKVLGEMAAELGLELYLVGGLVRDLLSGHDLGKLDVDLMLYPQHESFLDLFSDAELIASKGFSPVSKIDKFKKYFTSKVRFSEGQIACLDISGARCESYSCVAAKPEVERASVEEDLARRDFSINAVAISLSPKSFLQIIDPQGGVVDLKAKQLRILHEKSFYDDPIRLVRAARFIGRFAYQYEANTKENAKWAIEERLLLSVKTRRLLDETKKAVFEQEFSQIFPELERIGLFEAIGIRPGGLKMEELSSDTYAVLSLVLDKAGLIDDLFAKPSDYPFSKSEIERIRSFHL